MVTAKNAPKVAKVGDLQKWGLSTTTDFQAINVMLMNDDTEYVKHMLEALV